MWFVEWTSNQLTSKPGQEYWSGKLLATIRGCGGSFRIRLKEGKFFVKLLFTNKSQLTQRIWHT